MALAWLIQSTPQNASWRAVEYAPSLGLWAATCGDFEGTQAMTSPDGITWTLRTTPASTPDNSYDALVWSPELSLFVAGAAAGGSGSLIMTSPDGITWTLRTHTSILANTNPMCLTWSPTAGRFVMLSWASTAAVELHSTDGISWTVVNLTGANSRQWTDVIWAPELSLFIAVGQSGTGDRVMTSTDGLTWTNRTSAADNNWRNIAWSKELGLLVAVSDTGSLNRVMTSPDGISWTIRTTPSPDRNWTGIAWSAAWGLFVAVTSGGQVMASSDGITWTAQTDPPALNSWQDVGWSTTQGIFVSVGASGSGNRAMISTPAIFTATGVDPTNVNATFSPILSYAAADSLKISPERYADKQDLLALERALLSNSDPEQAGLIQTYIRKYLAIYPL